MDENPEQEGSEFLRLRKGLPREYYPITLLRVAQDAVESANKILENTFSDSEDIQSRLNVVWANIDSIIDDIDESD